MRIVALFALTLATSAALVFVCRHSCDAGGTDSCSHPEWADGWMRRWIAAQELKQRSVEG